MGFAALVSAVWGRAQAARAERLSELADEYIGCYVNTCARSGEELSDSVSAMSVSLEKLRVTGSAAARVLALEDIVRESAEAEKLLSRLPQSQIQNMGLAAFLTRIGDYARSVSKRLLSGGSFDERDAEQLDSMISAVGELNERLGGMVMNGEMPVGTEEFDYYDVSADEPSEPEYPTLIYDGPFSESTEKAEPLGLYGEDGSAEDAQRLAESIAGVPLTFDGKAEGRIPTYDCSAEGVDISITVRGLHLKYYMAAPSSDASGVPDDGEYEKYVSAGKDFLSSLGFDGMEPTYAQFCDGTALISFAWSLDGTIVYNDLVKVWIDRETLKPVGADAQNWLFSHREREIPAPTLSESEARERVSENLSVENIRLALIPTSPMAEALCYEFRGKCAECEFIVYINAETGFEEQIFKIVSDENGKSAV